MNTLAAAHQAAAVRTACFTRECRIFRTRCSANHRQLITPRRPHHRIRSTRRFSRNSRQHRRHGLRTSSFCTTCYHRVSRRVRRTTFTTTLHRPSPRTSHKHPSGSRGFKVFIDLQSFIHAHEICSSVSFRGDHLALYIQKTPASFLCFNCTDSHRSMRQGL